ncbi:MAG: GAF domain-containing protein, partial [Candidatus Binatia bacterium]
MHEHGTLHIPDRREQNIIPTLGSVSEWRTWLGVPLRLQEEFIGSLISRRIEALPFTPTQIKLLETFADQAVIAIENVRLFNELKESLEQQTATSEILGIIASSPTVIQPVLDVIAENASRICGTSDVSIVRLEGNEYRVVAIYGAAPNWSAGETRPLDRGSVIGRSMVDRQAIHIHDAPTVEDDFWRIKSSVGAVQAGLRTMLAIPLLREGVAIGAIGIRRTEVWPFSDKQIALLKIFADQAVIAIENVRLFDELGERNRQLTEALEQQTATSEILSVISSSPTDLQPVFETILTNAARLCDANAGGLYRFDGECLNWVAGFGLSPEWRASHSLNHRFRPGTESATRLAALERRIVHVPDILAASEFAEYQTGRQDREGLRTTLAVPLLKESLLVGVITIGRREKVQPYTDKQIALVKTFADQAVIAIENVRLFQELKESLEQQTATSEILGVIASSPTDIQPVLDAVAKNAARLCDAADAQINRLEGGVLLRVASYGSMPVPYDIGDGRPINRAHVGGRAIIDRQTIHIHDITAEFDTEFPQGKELQKRTGARTILATPLLREGDPIGLIVIRRSEVRPFTDKQITLLKTFADQAVIAIENVRLFQQLKESLEQQTATSEILGAIASSPTDLEPVLKIITERATRVCGAEDGVLRLVDGNVLRLAAHYGPIPDVAVERPINRQSPPGRALVDQTIIHYEDVDQVVELDYPEVRETHHRLRTGTFLAVPLIREDVGLGVIHFRRLDVRPFSDKQIALIKTFADQAVIAIENVRLFKELQERNAELREALEHQTATSEVLSIISRSPTDVQPVLDAIVESAARVCGVDDIVLRLREGNGLLARAHFGAVPIAHGREEISIDELHHRWIAQHGTLHIPDVRAHRDEFPTLGASVGARSLTFLIVPLRQRGEFIGTLNARRTEVRPFTPAQIKLLETFADQAVIAIENVRLFKELDERTNDLTRSVGELRALGEVSQVVSSTLDLETVLTRIVSHAVQLSGTDGGAIYEYDEPSEEFHLRATDHMEEELINALRANPPRLGDGVVGRAAASREPVQVPNILEERAYAPRMRQLLERFGFRASLAVPLLREDRIIGGLVVRRKSTGEFRPEVIELLKTFATQSVLAIQNARLFREIEEKSQQIQAANRHKSEFLANMSHELRTPLNAIIGFSEVLQEKLFGELNEKQAEYTDDILTSGRHLLSLINESLDL